jgi:hypothetical protein
VSDFGAGQGWLTEAELQYNTCWRGPDCACTGVTCRMARELHRRRALDLTPEEIDSLTFLRNGIDVTTKGGFWGGWEKKRDKALATLDRLLGRR